MTASPSPSAAPRETTPMQQQQMQDEGSTEKSALRAFSTASTTDVTQPTTREDSAMSPNEIGNFHEADGWYFKRMDDGSVRIQRTEEPRTDSPVTLEHVIPANAWASIVAHVSARGESGESFSGAQEFHAGRYVVRRPGDSLVLAGAAASEEERARTEEVRGEMGAAEVARTNAADLRDIRARYA